MLRNTTTLDGAYAVALTGSTAWLVNNSSHNLLAINISNPATPVITSELKNGPTLL